MIKIEFSEEEIKALHYERFHHPHPRVQMKMEGGLSQEPETVTSRDRSLDWHYRLHAALLSVRLPRERH